MAKFVRSSKLRHVFGTAAKKDQWFEGFNISGNSVDSAFCAVNPKFLAIILQSAGGGAFLVLTHSETGRLDPEHPRVGGHKMDVLDIAWNPFNDNMIASGSEDTTVKIWEIPEDGLKDDLTESALTLEGVHQRKVIQILWHPTVQNVLLSSGADYLIVIWNLETGEPATEIDCHPEPVFCVAWNTTGSHIVTSCKDKKIRVIEAREGKVIQEAKGHEGSKPQRVAFCDEFGFIFSVGFSKMSDRQYGIWKADTLEQLDLVDIDQSNAVLFIHYDRDLKMIYLAGKGDSIIRYYELVKEAPYCYWLSNYSPTTPQRGVCFMPKRGCNVTANEVAKCYKLIQKGSSSICEPIGFTVPRKSELFQEDIFPDTQGDEPSLTPDEWFAGKEPFLKLISLRPTGEPQVKKVHKPKIGLGRKPVQTKAAVVESGPANNELGEMVQKLKELVESQEKRIKTLEEKVEQLQTSGD